MRPSLWLGKADGFCALSQLSFLSLLPFGLQSGLFLPALLFGKAQRLVKKKPQHNFAVVFFMGVVSNSRGRKGQLVSREGVPLKLRICSKT